MKIAGPAANMPSEARLDMSWLSTALVFIVRLLLERMALHGNMWPEWGEAFSMLLNWLFISGNRLNSECRRPAEAPNLFSWQAVSLLYRSS